MLDTNKNREDHFDRCTRANEKDATKFLTNSIDSELETQLHEDCEDNDAFAAVWLHLTHAIRSVSVDRFDKIKERMKNRSIKTVRVRTQKR